MNSSYDARILRAAKRGAVAELVDGGHGLWRWHLNMRRVDAPVSRLIASGAMVQVTHHRHTYACAREYEAELREMLSGEAPAKSIALKAIKKAEKDGLGLCYREGAHVRMRAQDAARQELSAMTSELGAYEECFSAAQIQKMRKAMRGLRDFIASLDV